MMPFARQIFAFRKENPGILEIGNLIFMFIISIMVTWVMKDIMTWYSYAVDIMPYGMRIYRK